MSACPCGSKQNYDACCGLYIEGGQKPETAEQLMRSRYTAYTLENVDYIDTTHYPSAKDDFDKEQALMWAQNSEWKGLEIIETLDGGNDDQTGIVEFKVNFSLNDEDNQLHERSEFKKKNGVWFYLDGKRPIAQYRREEPKVGRNDPCICGSGKKYKKCCGLAA